ncbi:MAG: hypothetical protein HYX37_18350 [Rhizobiales bacterium]|nr:hypothetical protein [Hyphomicrobiales bacterium]
MRGFASYLLAGILVVVAMDFIAPPIGLGLPVGAWPTVEQGSLVQSVNRGNKGDRLSVPTAVDKSQAPRKSPTVLVGCDPVFSPLSASARANVARHCVA